MKIPQQRLTDVRKALSGKQMTVKGSAAICGGDDLKLFPWIDQPGG